MLAFGFSHVSDDDFARVTIAQSFAHAPKLDPSGTSWLPFPFWALGSLMIVAGRSLLAARAGSVAFASLGVGAFFAALRAAGVPRGRASLAVAFAALSPWSLWLGAATVPESLTASLCAAAALALGGEAPEGAARDGDPGDRPPWPRLGWALALVAATLSRYEAWPVAATLAATLALRASNATTPRARRLHLTLAALAALGPALWMAWNLHAHQDALHFFQRVSRFKRALGEAPVSTTAALLLYPRLLATTRPDVLAAAAAAVVAGASGLSRPELRRRWLVPLLCAASQLAFLAYGNTRDGAPAHHSERALLGTIFVLAAFAADALASAASELWARGHAGRALASGGLLLALAGWLGTARASLRDVPGASAAEAREVQLRKGASLRAEHIPGLDVTPCAYEHFALIAAYGAPERVTIHPASGAPLTSACPSVDRR